VVGQTGLSPFSFSEILEHCLEPTIRDGAAHIGKLIFWCIVFRILTQAGKKTLTDFEYHFYFFDVVDEPTI